MIRTAVCELLGIDHPIIQAGMGPFTSAALAAAVSNAGGLGSIGTFRQQQIALRPEQTLERQLSSIRDLTERPFAVNCLVPDLDEHPELLELALGAHPALVSFALGPPDGLADRVHDAGVLMMHQVTTVEQARDAAAAGVDLIVAQGGEAGGFGGTVASMPLVPQVVDAVRPVPVIAAGGIFDGRGLAAALVLGAAGVNVGTRFLASREAAISDRYKRAIVDALSEDAVKFEALNEIIPHPGARGYGTTLRTIRTAFVDAWRDRPERARDEAERLRRELQEAIGDGRVHEVLPTAGQSAGGVDGIAPAAEIVERMISVAETALATAGNALVRG